jgi:hypothetical protein
VVRPEETIDGTCPSCGQAKIAIIASGLWDGWRLPEGRPASGISLYGRCHRCGAVLQGCAEADEEVESMTWSMVEEGMVEKLEWLLSGRKHWWQFWRRA